MTDQFGGIRQDEQKDQFGGVIPPAPAPQSPSALSEFFKSIPTGIANTALAAARGEQIESEQRASAFGEPNAGPDIPTDSSVFGLHKPQGIGGTAGRITGEFAANPATYLGPEGIFYKAVVGLTGIAGTTAGEEATKGTRFEPVGGMLGSILGGSILGIAHASFKPVQDVISKFDKDVTVPTIAKVVTEKAMENGGNINVATNDTFDELDQLHAQQIIGKLAPETINIHDITAREATAPREFADSALRPQNLSAAVTPEVMRGQAMPRETPDQYEARFTKWIDKIDAQDDVRELIDKVARENGFFPQARAGEVTPAHVNAVAEAAGVDPKEIDGEALSSRFDSDAKVNATIYALRRTTRDFIDAQTKMRENPSEENAAAALVAEERNRLVTEYVLGKRADSSRGLSAWKQLLREQERATAVREITKGEAEGKLPKGLADVVDAARDIQSNIGTGAKGKAGLDKLVKAAKDLVEGQDKLPETRQKLGGLAKRARDLAKEAEAKEAEAGKTPSGLASLISEAEELAKTLPEGTKEAGKPQPQGIPQMIAEARRAVNGPSGGAALIKLAEQAERLAMTMPRTPAEATAALTPEVRGLIDSARGTLKKLRPNATGITPVEGSGVSASTPRSQLALGQEPHINALLNSPVTKDVIDNAVVDRTHDVPYTAGGSEPMNDRTTYIDKDFPRQFTISGKKFDPAEPFVIHENVEQHAMQLLEKGGMDKATAYKVAHFEFAEKAEGAWYRAHGIDQAAAERAYKPYLNTIQRKTPTNVPKNLYKDPYPHDSPFAAQHEALSEPHPTQAEIERAKQIIADWQARGSPGPKPIKQPNVDDTALQKMVDAAERQIENVRKQKPTNTKTENVLPPEWQALVDKADFVTKRFGGVAKGEEAAFMLAKAGRSAAEQAEIARSVEGMTPTQVARVLDRLQKDKGTPWYYAIPQQAFLTGPITHTLYAAVNTANVVYRRMVQPFVASLFDKVLPGKSEMSTLAAIRAGPELVNAIPDAARRAWRALKTGERVLSLSEERLIARGEPTPTARGAAATPYTKNRIDWGWVRNYAPDGALAKADKVVTAPGSAANAIHTFFRILGDRASAGQIAYTKATREVKFSEIGSQKFWSRYEYHLANPEDADLATSAERGFAGTYMEEMGPAMQKLSSLVKETPLKWLVFFMHIPFNIVKQGAELMPMGLAAPLTNTRMGRALRGELGREEQSLSLASLVVGGAISAYFIHRGMTGEATGNFPTDPKEKQRWKDMNIQPYSDKVGDQWVSMERWGSLGMPMKAAADYGYIFSHHDFTNPEDAAKGAMALILGTAHIMMTDSGFDGVMNVIKAIEDRDERANALNWQLSGYAQPVSAVSQAASLKDPYMRETANFIDAFKNRIPGLRETLPVKRDPVFGTPLPNPGYASILRQTPVNANPVKAELDRLHVYPQAPEKTIAKVKLTPEQYDKYEALAGNLVQRTLSAVMQSDGYRNMSDLRKAALIKDAITGARAKAAQTLVFDDKSLRAAAQDLWKSARGIGPQQPAQ